MLVLSRRRGESLWIGADVIVTVVGVNGSRVRVGIEAPSRVAIKRAEIVERAAPATCREIESPENCHATQVSIRPR